eukprot:Sdes_comp15972_c0_seq1m5126
MTMEFEVGLLMGIIFAGCLQYFLIHRYKQLNRVKITPVVEKFSEPVYPKSVTRISDRLETLVPESCSWLNTFIGTIIIDYLGKNSIQEKLCSMLNKSFEERTENSGTIGNLRVNEFDLGETLPLFREAVLVKLTPHETKVSMNVYYNGGFKLQIYAEVVSVGVLLSVTVVEFQGSLSVSIREGNRIAIGFDEDPYMVLDVKFKAGAIASSKIANFINNKLKQVIRSKLVYPNLKIIQLGQKKQSIRGNLQLTVISGSQLPSMDSNGFSDPYCVVTCGESHPSRKTKIIPKCLNPVWNEVFLFDGVYKNEDVVIEVWDHDKFKEDDFIGLVDYPLYNIDFDQPQSVELPLKSRKSSDMVTGSISISFLFTSASNSFQKNPFSPTNPNNLPS